MYVLIRFDDKSLYICNKNKVLKVNSKTKECTVKYTNGCVYGGYLLQTSGDLAKLKEKKLMLQAKSRNEKCNERSKKKNKVKKDTGDDIIIDISKSATKFIKSKTSYEINSDLQNNDTNENKGLANKENMEEIFNQEEKSVLKTHTNVFNTSQCFAENMQLENIQGLDKSNISLVSNNVEPVFESNHTSTPKQVIASVQHVIKHGDQTISTESKVEPQGFANKKNSVQGVFNQEEKSILETNSNVCNTDQFFEEIVQLETVQRLNKSDLSLVSNNKNLVSGSNDTSLLKFIEPDVSYIINPGDENIDIDNNECVELTNQKKDVVPLTDLCDNIILNISMFDESIVFEDVKSNFTGLRLSDNERSLFDTLDMDIPNLQSETESKVKELIVTDTNKSGENLKDSTEKTKPLVSSTRIVDCDSISERRINKNNVNETCSEDIINAEIDYTDRKELFVNEVLNNVKVGAPNDDKLHLQSEKNKKHNCLFCNKLVCKIARHLEFCHREEKIVQDFINLPKGSKGNPYIDITERNLRQTKRPHFLTDFHDCGLFENNNLSREYMFGDSGWFESDIQG
ncbi:uncharacterized protein [Prorops nasuta]|uniref:uncharacterized protein n=1 Tax=Prorops nasuta TaxID=863751 RepID=UPI0034CF778D